MLQMILLPYPSFRKSVACYSDNVLIQTLRIILTQYPSLSKSRDDIRWQEKNIWLFWSQWKQAYIRLGMMCAEEAALRNIPYDRAAATNLFQVKRGKHWTKPLWINWEHLHSDHRAALLQIGEVERIGLRIVKWERLENASSAVQIKCVNDWFDAQGFNGLFEGDETYNREVNDFLTARGAPLLVEHPNYYAQFNWTEQPCGTISTWPPEPEDSWILT